MPEVIYVSADNTNVSVDVPVGWTVMEGARDYGLDGIVAECGGGAICGTCHVQVDPAWYDRLDAPQGTEAALLQIVPERCDTSRLACQIVMSDELDGIRVRIPTEQFSG